MYIRVTVTAGARKEVFVQKSEDHFASPVGLWPRDISVKEKAERNMANVRVLEIVAKYFKISKNKVRIVNGHHHFSKLLVVES